MNKRNFIFTSRFRAYNFQWRFQTLKISFMKWIVLEFNAFLVRHSYVVFVVWEFFRQIFIDKFPLNWFKLIDNGDSFPLELFQCRQQRLRDVNVTYGSSCHCRINRLVPQRPIFALLQKENIANVHYIIHQFLGDMLEHFTFMMLFSTVLTPSNEIS